MFTVWICIECLHRILRSRLLRVLSRTRGGEKKRQIKRRVKNTRCQLKMFSNVTV